MPTIDNFSIIFNGTSNVATFANSAPNTSVADTFTYEIWCSPTNTHQIDTQSTTGFSGNTGQRYLIHPANVSNSISNWYNSADIGVSIGTNGVSVYEYRSDSANGVFHMPALLVASNTVSPERFTQVVV